MINSITSRFARPARRRKSWLSSLSAGMSGTIRRKHLIPVNTGHNVKSVSGPSQLVRCPGRSKQSLARMTKGSEKGEHDVPRESKSLITWLRAAAVIVTNAILEYLSSIILTEQKRSTTFPTSYRVDIRGLQRYLEKKYLSVASSAPTATDSTQSSSSNITLTPELEKPLTKSLNGTELMHNMTSERMEAFRSGRLRLDQITVAEWMHMSLLSLFDGDELHRDEPIIYNGGVYKTHISVSFVSPPEQVQNLRKKQ